MNAWDEWLEHEYGPVDEKDEDEAYWRAQDRYDEEGKRQNREE